MSETYRIVDLFAGCGGFTAGFLRANGRNGSSFRPIAAVERDPDAAATYEHNIGIPVFLGEVQDWPKSDQFPTHADLILGGPPCQGFSALRKKKLLDVDDDRKALWSDYADIVASLTPGDYIGKCPFSRVGRPVRRPAHECGSVRDVARVPANDGERQLFRRCVADTHVFLKLDLRRLVARIVLRYGLLRHWPSHLSVALICARDAASSMNAVTS